MKGFEKLLLFIFSISFLVLSLLTLLIGLGFFKYDVLLAVTNLLDESGDFRISVIVFSGLFIILSFFFMIKSLKYNHVNSFSNIHSEIGEIKISTDTLENLASKVSAKINGVKEQKVRVKLEENGSVIVVAKIYVDGETPIPQISEQIQFQVKENIQNIAGIDVGQVHVIVANVGPSSQKKSRIE